MKKRLFALALAVALVVNSGVPVLAYKKDPTYSPEKKETITPTITPKTTITPKSTITPRVTTPPRTTIPPRSPKTGEVDYVLIGTLGTAACASIVVLSKKKKNEEES